MSAGWQCGTALRERGSGGEGRGGGEDEDAGKCRLASAQTGGQVESARACVWQDGRDTRHKRGAHTVAEVVRQEHFKSHTSDAKQKRNKGRKDGDGEHVEKEGARVGCKWGRHGGYC